MATSLTSLAPLGIKPFVEAVNMIKQDDLKPECRALLLKELMKYVAPQLKAVDVDAKVSGSIRVVVDTFREALPAAPGMALEMTIAPPLASADPSHDEEGDEP